MPAGQLARTVWHSNQQSAQQRDVGWGTAVALGAAAMTATSLRAHYLVPQQQDAAENLSTYAQRKSTERSKVNGTFKPQQALKHLTGRPFKHHANWPMQALVREFSHLM